MKWLARYLKRKLTPPERLPDHVIGGAIDPSMDRWWVIRRNHYFNIYLHRMLRDDEDVPHDHPWWSLSLILSDGLIDYSWPNGVKGRLVARVLKQGQWVLRRPSTPHRLVVLRPAWTLFFTGPNIRTWGFHCPKGWMPWKKYVGIDGEERFKAGLPNKGCGDE